MKENHVLSFIGYGLADYGLFFCGPTLASDMEGSIPPLLVGLRLEQTLSFCGEVVPLEDPEVRERMEKELLLSLWDRDQAILWLKRSTRYLPVIEAMLSRAGLPDDLKYIALAESALRPHVGSPKGRYRFLAIYARDRSSLRLDHQ